MNSDKCLIIQLLNISTIGCHSLDPELCVYLSDYFRSICISTASEYASSDHNYQTNRSAAVFDLGGKKVVKVL